MKIEYDNSYKTFADLKPGDTFVSLSSGSYGVVVKTNPHTEKVAWFSFNDLEILFANKDAKVKTTKMKLVIEDT